MLFETPEDYYQAIGNELNSIIEEPWEKAEVEALLDGISVNIKVVYLKKDGSKESNVDVYMLPDYFYELSKVVSGGNKDLYKKCFFTLRSNGKYKVDFEY
ncbi:hypothetical protein QO259_14935 [Salinicola sp. JS01]|uniref:hypothetical protein n=1 Tax=Salinicola sp. JS01 TaxID=3050071 RepID=UPI00255B853F|nr:hypothetical protein [Salinicola sp. JS01]WIX32091.1 hypothetical protein QO259_14935 [Salinicola sp. JS01]